MSQHNKRMAEHQEPTFFKSYPVVHKANPKKLDALFALYTVYQKEYKRFATQSWAQFKAHPWAKKSPQHEVALKLMPKTITLSSRTSGHINGYQGLYIVDDLTFKLKHSTKDITTTLNASFLQNCLKQVAATLNGHLTAIENRFNKILRCSSIKNADLLHQLRSINQRQEWLHHQGFYFPRQLLIDDHGNGFYRSSKKVQALDDYGYPFEVTDSQITPVSLEAQRLARHIFQSITRSHIRFPNLDKPKMVLDTRTCEIQEIAAQQKQANKKKGIAAQQKQASKRFDYWLNISTLVKNEKVLVPILCTPHFKKAFGELGRTVEFNFTTHPYLVTEHKHDSLPLTPSSKKAFAALGAKSAGGKGQTKGKMAAAAKKLEKKLQDEKRQHVAQRKTVKVTRTLTITLNKKPTLTELRQQMQAQNAQAVQVPNNAANTNTAVCHNGNTNSALQAFPAVAISPLKTHNVGFDLGLSTLIASSDGELYGQNWLKRLKKYDEDILSLSSQRQKLKLKVRSKCYDELVEKVRGFIRSEINRILKCYFQEHPNLHTVVIEKLSFNNPNLSRRLNRIIKNFGQKVFKDKLKSLGELYGVAIEEVEAAYSSQECSACGYVDKKNRTQQKHFKCKACGTSKHADYNASRVILGRSQNSGQLQLSWLATKTGKAVGKKQVLEALKQSFLKKADSFSLQRKVARRALDLVLSENPYFTKPKPKLVITREGPRVAPAVAFVGPNEALKTTETTSIAQHSDLMKAGSLF